MAGGGRRGGGGFSLSVRRLCCQKLGLESGCERAKGSMGAVWWLKEKSKKQRFICLFACLFVCLFVCNRMYQTCATADPPDAIFAGYQTFSVLES